MNIFFPLRICYLKNCCCELFIYPRICQLKNFCCDLRLIFVFYYSDLESFWQGWYENFSVIRGMRIIIIFFFSKFLLRSEANILLYYLWALIMRVFLPRLMIWIFFSEYVILAAICDLKHLISKNWRLILPCSYFCIIRIMWLKEKLFCSSIKSFYFSCHGSRRFLSSR